MLKISLILGRFNELPGGNQSQVIQFARIADEVGIYGLTLGDHLVLGNRLDRYPYSGGFRHPEGPLTPYLEPVAVLGAFAAATTRVRLSTSILLAPLRSAVLLAKQLATIDVLSNGRCEPSLGYGWQIEEYQASGVEWSARRRIFRDSIAACRALWGSQPVTFKSETVSFEGLHAMPRPIQTRIPILLGVKLTDSNVALITEHCDGWDPAVSAASSDEMRYGSAQLRKAFVDSGRDPQQLIVRAHIAAVWNDDGFIDLERSFEPVGEMLECGANQIAFQIPRGYGEALDSMFKIESFITAIAKIAEEH